jgi:DNA-binding transcriptional regulator YhcF (GntR family)
MFFRIEKGSSVPITRQLAEQIRAQCLSGTLGPGARLPSVRELARELALNVNTVFRVYEQLAAEQLIELRHGDGTFVRERAAIGDTVRQLESQRQQYALEFEALVRRGLLLGLTATELRRKLSDALKEAGRSLGGSTAVRENKS